MAIKLRIPKPLRATQQSAPENVLPLAVVEEESVPLPAPREGSREQGRHHASSLSELLHWLRTAINLTDLAVRLGAPHPAGTASPAVEKITELAAWLLHTITGLVS